YDLHVELRQVCRDSAWARQVMKKLLFALALLFAAPLMAVNTFYLSSGGSGTTCSTGSPGPISAIFCGTPCTGHGAGDTYYLKAGTYSTSGLVYSSTDGTTIAPIWVIGDPAGGQCPRSNNAHCPVEIINTGGANSVGISINGSHVRFQGFEIDAS